MIDPVITGPTGQGLGSDDESVAAVLLETARALTRAAARTAGPGERRALTGAQMDVLLDVRRNPGQSVTQLADRLQLARNTVSTLVGQLDQAGLLVRSTDSSDARVTLLSLSPAAAERMARWRARRAAAVQQALDALSPPDRAAVEEALGPLRVLVAAIEGGPAVTPSRPGPSQPGPSQPEPADPAEPEPVRPERDGAAGG
jgi:DNA-binding MarR family transcriptional regulator